MRPMRRLHALPPDTFVLQVTCHLESKHIDFALLPWGPICGNVSIQCCAAVRVSWAASCYINDILGTH